MRNAARRWSVRTAIVVALLLLVTLATSTTALADISGMPAGITDEAEKIKTNYIIVLVMALIVFVIVEAALLFIILRYRRRRDDEVPAQTHGNNVVEVIWTGIPIVIVLILFVVSFVTLVEIEGDADDEDLTVHVQGFTFSWRFTYCANDDGTGADAPEAGEDAEYSGPCATEADEVSVIGVGEDEPVLTIPIDEPVEFALSSPDVIHSFYVRDFLYKLDVIPGRDNRFVVTARETGEYRGQCAELCGLNHALMRFTLRVVSRAEFETFLAEQLAENNEAAARPR